jgi:acyl-CoA thioester hydrolase
MEIKIYYDDTDAGGVVYHANYLKYFERGRSEYMRQRGVDPAEMAQSGLIFVIVWAELSYLSPARYGDTLTVETFIDEISHASLTFGYKIYLSGKSAGTNNKLLVTGKTKIAMVNKAMKVQRFSDDFIERLKAVL